MSNERHLITVIFPYSERPLLNHMLSKASAFGKNLLKFKANKFFSAFNLYETNYYLCTINTKLRSFQIKLNVRLIVTNIQLSGFGLIESDNSKFCCKVPKTLLHFFFAHVKLLLHIGKMFQLAFLAFLKILFPLIISIKSLEHQK